MKRQERSPSAAPLETTGDEAHQDIGVHLRELGGALLQLGARVELMTIEDARAQAGAIESLYPHIAQIDAILAPMVQRNPVAVAARREDETGVRAVLWERILCALDLHYEAAKEDGEQDPSGIARARGLRLVVEVALGVLQGFFADPAFAGDIQAHLGAFLKEIQGALDATVANRAGSDQAN